MSQQQLQRRQFLIKIIGLAGLLTPAFGLGRVTTSTNTTVVNQTVNNAVNNVFSPTIESSCGAYMNFTVGPCRPGRVELRPSERTRARPSGAMRG